MTQETRELLERALKLPPGDRALIAHELLDSIEGDEEDPAAVEAAWREEIAKRARDVIEGREPGVPAAQVLDELDEAIAEERTRRRSS